MWKLAVSLYQHLLQTRGLRSSAEHIDKRVGLKVWSTDTFFHVKGLADTLLKGSTKWGFQCCSDPLLTELRDN